MLTLQVQNYTKFSTNANKKEKKCFRNAFFLIFSHKSLIFRALTIILA